MIRPSIYGAIAGGALITVYFFITSMVSGWDFAVSQFFAYGNFIVSLAVGFGVQVALYLYLKDLVQSGQGMGKIVGVSGTTSTAAMISCCAHYLVNIVPVLGVTGFATLIAQYQTRIFWVGIAFNIFGIIFISRKIIAFKKEHE